MTEITWKPGLIRIKDPDASLPFTVIFDDLDAANPITVAAVTATPTGLTIGSPSIIASTGIQALISGGTAGITYSVKFRYTSSLGWIDDRSILIEVRER